MIEGTASIFYSYGRSRYDSSKTPIASSSSLSSDRSSESEASGIGDSASLLIYSSFGPFIYAAA